MHRSFSCSTSAFRIEPLEDRRYLASPSVTASALEFETAPHTVMFDFDQPVEGSLASNDLHTEGLTTGDTVNANLASYTSGDIARFHITGYTNGILPQGNYQSTIFADAVRNVSGEPMSADANVHYFFLPADANRDREVNLDDWNLFAGNMGTSGHTFSGGNFDYDASGTVNLDDWNILASYFGATQPEMPAPGSLSVAQGPAQNVLSWTGFPSMPADVTHFRIQRSTDSQIFTTYATVDIATMNFVDDGDADPATSGPGLPPGSRFWYRVRAIGGTTGGTSYTPKQAGTTVMTPPENVRGTAQSSTSILVQWDDVTSNETRFELRVHDAADNVLQTITNVPANFTSTGSYLVPNLTPNTGYKFSMLAWGPALESAWTLPSGTVTTDVAPVVSVPVLTNAIVNDPNNPANFSVTYTLSTAGEPPGTIEVALEVVTDDGEFEEVYRGPGNGSAITTAAAEGTRYAFRMRALRDGTPGEYSNVVYRAVPPRFPTNMEVSVTGDTATLGWLDQSQKESGFELTVEEFETGQVERRYSPPANTEAFEIEDLPDGKTYFAKLRTVGDSGASFWQPYPIEVPILAPAAFTATAVSPTEVNLTWQDNSVNETGYYIEYSYPSGDPYPPGPDPSASAIAPPNATGFPIIGLNPGTTYTFRLAGMAPNSSGWGWHAPITITTLTGSPPDGEPPPPPQPSPQAPPSGTTLYRWTISGSPRVNTSFDNTNTLTFGGASATAWSATPMSLGAAAAQVSGTIRSDDLGLSTTGTGVQMYTYPGPAFRLRSVTANAGTIGLEDQTNREPIDRDFDDGVWTLTLETMVVGQTPPPVPPAPPPPTDPADDELPWVWITTTDAQGSEWPDSVGSTPGTLEFTVWRSQPTSSSLVVSLFPAAGTATADDYTGMPSSVILGGGSDHASFTVAPVDDDEFEPLETFFAILKANASYHLSFGYQAAAVIRDNDPDLDIDSDNNNGFGTPLRSTTEDRYEDSVGGKVIVVNRDDDDNDGILDFADGFNAFGDTAEDVSTASEQFVPIVLRVPSNSPWNPLIAFHYDAADPSTVSRTAIVTQGLDGVSYTTHNYNVGEGLLRLWAAPATSPRTENEYLAPGEQFYLNPSAGGLLTVYIEAVNGSAAFTDISVSITVPNYPPQSDTIRVLPLDPLVGVEEPEILGYSIRRGDGASLWGTSENDILIGTAGAEFIGGQSADDLILTGRNEPADVDAAADRDAWGGDTIDGGAGGDVIFSWFGNNEITSDSVDEIVRIEGSAIDTGESEGGDTLHQPFTGQDIETYYKWMYGADDIWLRGFKELDGQVLGVKQDGRWFSDWTIDWRYTPGLGPLGTIVGYDVKIEYDVGIMKAAALLREGIMSTAFHDSFRWTQFFQNQNALEIADGVVFGESLVAWKEMRERNFGYAQQVAEIAGDLYFSGMTVAAGVGGEIAEAIIEFDDTLETAGDLAKGALDLLRYATGRVIDWVQEPVVTAGPLLDGEGAEATAPPPAGGEPEVIPGRARAALKFAGILAYKEYNDVIRPLVRVGGETIESPIGFVWRRDLLPAGEDSLKIVPHVAHGRTTMIIGTPQITSGTHATTMERWAKKIVDDAPNKQFTYIGLNRSARTLLDDGVTAGRKVNGDHSLHRPDIFAVYWDPVTSSPKVEMYEIPSGPQDPNVLVTKMTAIMDELPVPWQTNVKQIIQQDPP